MELLEERIRRDGVVKSEGVLKVDSFLKYIGCSTCLQLRSVKTDELCRMIDMCMSGVLDGEVSRNAKLLREREHENVRGAAALLGMNDKKKDGETA